MRSNRTRSPSAAPLTRDSREYMSTWQDLGRSDFRSESPWSVADDRVTSETLGRRSIYCINSTKRRARRLGRQWTYHGNLNTMEDLVAVFCGTSRYAIHARVRIPRQTTRIKLNTRTSRRNNVRHTKWKTTIAVGLVRGSHGQQGRRWRLGRHYSARASYGTPWQGGQGL